MHLGFDVKHGHTARLVTDGHLSEPVETVYSGGVSLISLRLTVFMAEVNNLEIWGANIGDACLETYTDDMAGPEFKELQGHVLVIRHALYRTQTGGTGGMTNSLMS